MSNTDKALSNALGIEYKEPVKQEVIAPIQKESQLSSDAESDYALARQTFRNLIQQGNLAMEDMKELARQSESPRAFEVLATMMKTIADTTNNLYDLQKKTKELKEVKDKPTQPDGAINVERAVFVGTTSDLLKKIKEQKQ